MAYRQEKMILIVDDERTITSALNLHLVQAGYETAVAHSGHEALEKLSLNPSLVVLDIMLPDISPPPPSPTVT